jgi:hypothetical protein
LIDSGEGSGKDNVVATPRKSKEWVLLQLPPRKGFVPEYDRAKAEEDMIGFGRMGSQDLTKRIQVIEIHPPHRRLLPRPF